MVEVNLIGAMLFCTVLGLFGGDGVSVLCLATFVGNPSWWWLRNKGPLITLPSYLDTANLSHDVLMTRLLTVEPILVVTLRLSSP